MIHAPSMQKPCACMGAGPLREMDPCVQSHGPITPCRTRAGSMRSARLLNRLQGHHPEPGTIVTIRRAMRPAHDWGPLGSSSA